MSRHVASPADILAELRSLAGAAGPAVEFRGDDPVFPTRFRIGAFGAAVVGAAASQAARVFELRTGRAQDVAVDVDAAAAGMRSFRYLSTLTGEAASMVGVPSAFYRTADDRTIFVHRASPVHFTRELSVLGVGDDEADIVAAIRKWPAHELESAIMAAGACAAVVRSRDEWRSHPQGRAVAGMPLFSIRKIGESEPIRVGDGIRPLGGVRVLDLTRVLAGPTNARTLAEYGADVLRVVSPLHPDAGVMPMDTGHGKRSTLLDLRAEDHSAQLRRLIAGADVFSQGFRPGAFANLGFSPEVVAGIRPGIISVAISAWGEEGPWRSERGFDSVVEAANGMADDVPGAREPRLIPASPLDYASGYLAAFLVQVALERRALEGGSYHIELSLAQTAHYLDGLGRVPAGEASAASPELSRSRIDELSVESDTPFGRLRHLGPIAQLSSTPGRWDRPTPADNDPAEWG